MDASTIMALGQASSGLAGQIYQNWQNRRNFNDANNWNAEQTAQQMQFQERMSNTAYQRAMTDMKEAGLNPMLAYMNGGASSPSGASASTNPVHTEDFISKTVGSALAFKQQRDAFEKDQGVKDSQISLNNAAEKAQKANAEKATADAKTASLTAQSLATQLPAQAKKAAYDAEKYESDKKFLQYDQYASRALQATGALSNVSDIFKLFKKPTNQSTRETVIDGNTGEILHSKP